MIVALTPDVLEINHLMRFVFFFLILFCDFGIARIKHDSHSRIYAKMIQEEPSRAAFVEFRPSLAEKRIDRKV